MFGVIREIVSRFRMGKDCQSATVESEKLRNVAERIAGYGELHAATWVGANGAQMEMTHSDREASLGRCGELLR